MNTLLIFPKKIRQAYVKNIKYSGIQFSAENYNKISLQFSFLLSVISSLVFYFLEINIFYSFFLFFFFYAIFYFYASLTASTRIRKMETLFPEVISLMASNLRAGMTIDRAFLLSSRKDFAPLDEYIIKAGREITTGEDVETVLIRMGERINSEKISKTLKVIISGIRAGGNISNILELSARNLKEKEFIEKRIVSNILMYVIFIFFAVGVGAPILFSLSSVLVGVILNLSSQVPQTASSQINLPISFNKVSISVDFIVYYSLIFIVITDFISCLVMGLVNKGEEKSGLKYFLPLVLISLIIFFTIRLVLLSYFGGIFPG